LAVEPPLRAEHREELVWLLAQLAELATGLHGMARDIESA
jgi:hypothetical protein